jgi:hypothetical protein
MNLWSCTSVTRPRIVLGCNVKNNFGQTERMLEEKSRKRMCCAVLLSAKDEERKYCKGCVRNHCKACGRCKFYLL